MNSRQILVTALFLFVFAATGTALVALTFDNTQERIAANERATLLRNLHVLIPPDTHDNDIFNDIIEITNPDALGSNEPAPIYRARKQGWPVAAVLTTVAPDGYSGAIKLLVGINLDGSLAGVRVVSHRETPGLGDAIEAKRSDWILDFTGRSLRDPVLKQWAVKRDGGVFDQFTGATITPRAVVKAVKKALIYFNHNSQRLFASDSTRTAPLTNPTADKARPAGPAHE